jgi:DNA repair protein RadC
MNEPVHVKNPESLLPLLQKWQKQKQENFLTITLNGALEVIKVHHISKGIINRTIVHPRECFYPAIKDLAVAVILIHNHPSGLSSPSPEDDDITKRMSMAAEIMGIKVVDHIIITPSHNHYSYRKEGKLPFYHRPCEIENFVESLQKDYAEYY